MKTMSTARIRVGVIARRLQIIGHHASIIYRELRGIVMTLAV